MREFISTGHAGAVLGVSRERVLAYIRDGRLKVAAQDGFGRRFLRREDVERLRHERKQFDRSGRD